MQAKDVMTRDVTTVSPEATVREIAQLLLERRISAVPVVNAESELLGIVSEGDLIRRPEGGTTRPASWWLSLLTTPEDSALDYVKTHGGHARDVMTRKLVTVDEDTPLWEVARTLEKHHVKRVPVLKGGKLVGIVRPRRPLPLTTGRSSPRSRRPFAMPNWDPSSSVSWFPAVPSTCGAPSIPTRKSRPCGLRRKTSPASRRCATTSVCCRHGSVRFSGPSRAVPPAALRGSAGGR